MGTGQTQEEVKTYCSGKGSPQDLLMTTCWGLQMLPGPRPQRLEGLWRPQRMKGLWRPQRMEAGSNWEQLDWQK